MKQWSVDGSRLQRRVRKRSIIAIGVWILIASVSPSLAVADPLVDNRERQTADEESDEQTIPPFPTSESDDGAKPTNEPPPLGTPFDDWVPRATEPLPPPAEWEFENATEMRAAMGFPADSDLLRQLFDRSVVQPNGPEASGRQRYGFPTSAKELTELERRDSMMSARTDLVEAASAVVGFAGSWIDQPAGGVQVLAFSPAARQIEIEGVVANYKFPSFLRIERVNLSLRDLLEIRDASRASLIRAGIDETMWRVSSSNADNEVLVDVAREIIDSVAVQLLSEDPRVVVEVVADLPSEQEVDCLPTDCLPVTAGLDANVCTWGFVSQTGSNLRILSAGHCTPTNMRLNGVTPVLIQRIDNPGWRDLAVYNIGNDLSATNDLLRSEAGSNRFGFEVSSSRNPQQFENVCKRGMTTDFTCGFVRTVNPGEEVVATYRSCPGDSGAPVFVTSGPHSRIAVGIHEDGNGGGGCPNSPTAGDRTFTAIEELSDWRSNDAVYIGGTPRRDFVISAYDRALDREPDAGGFNYWVGGACNSTSIDGIVFGFMAGSELKANPLLNNVNSSTELRRRLAKLYRVALRRSSSFAEQDNWKQWIWDNAPNYPGNNQTEQRESAYNAVVDWFIDSPEGQALFQPGGGVDGEIRLCVP